MNRIVLYLIGTLISLATSIQSDAAEYLVADIKEFNLALAKVKAGDVITWKSGDYKDMKIDFKPMVNGTSLKPIVLRAQTAGKVSFSGSSKIKIGGTYLQVEGFLFQGNCTLENGEHVIDFSSKLGGKMTEANHCRVTNCAVVNYTLTDESGKTNYDVNLVGSYNEVDHCYFKGKTNKGPTLVVEYKQDSGYVPGSDVAPSSFHHIHHNYFGYRTFSSNGGEQMRLGTSTTSFTHGFNIVEYNYMEDERLEAETISNKSWDNIYRFNTFVGNDGGMVIRHGQKCFVYGNYVNGKSGRNNSAGLRIVNPNNTVFNNYVENIEGGNKGFRSAIAIMAGLEGSAINGYYPADNAIVAYNTLVRADGPAIRVGIGNSSKGKGLVAPKNVLLVGNSIIETLGSNINPVEVDDSATTFTSRDNAYTNGTTREKGFYVFSGKKLNQKNGITLIPHVSDMAVIDSINQRLAIHHIKLSEKEITQFDPSYKIDKKLVGVSWIKL